MAGQGRLGDKANAPVDIHGCLACPHPVSGPGVSGSPDVLVNSRPALRATDKGIHGACCAGNKWTALLGSPSVFINGKPAHRSGDLTVHCGGIGRLVEGSDDVIVGGALNLGLLMPSIGSLTLPKLAVPGLPLTLSLGALKFPTPALVFPHLAATWTVDGKVLPMIGETITITLGLEHAGRNISIRADLGHGSKPYETALAVPKLTLDGPDTVEVGEKIAVRGTVSPPVEGRYAWFDCNGKRIGTERTATFVGKTKSKKDGDQPVECRFTASATGTVYTERHPITVEKVPTLTLPINISLDDLGKTVDWLAKNPIEVQLDSAVVGSHALVESAGRIVVSFRAPPGDHAIVISSGAAHFASNQPKIRIVHFSCKVKVTAVEET